MPSAAELLQVAFEQHRAGNLAQAEQLYRQILVQSPQHADVLHLLGALSLQTCRPAEAVDLIQRAIAINPASPDYYNHLGAALGTLKQHDQAVASLRRAVELAPNSAATHYNLGTALREAGQLESALESFRRAVALDPRAAEARYNLGNTLRELRQFAEAEASFRAALQVRPNYVKAMVNLGNVLRDQDRLDEAAEVLRLAVWTDPRHANAHLNLGTVLRDRGEFDQAEQSLRQAMALDPTSAEVHNNLGTTLQAQARFAEAGELYEEALRLDPELADAHFSRSTLRLRRGDLRGGLEEYEWRWRCKSYSTRRFAEPRWDGEPLEGRKILLHAEQGLGDTLQFVRYAARVKERGGRVILECQAPLVKLLGSCVGIDQLVPVGETLPPYDVHCPLMSLPHALALDADNLWFVAYLEAGSKLIDQWHARLQALAGFKIGVCWQGNRKHLFDRQRSFALAQLAPVAAIPGVRLVSLQKGFGSEQVDSAGFELLDLGPELDEAQGAFIDTAAVMKKLDLVITSDTSLAHLAGGLGVPVWLPLSVHCDWRWGMIGETTPWYPTMRLFRQQTLNEWGSVFASIAAEVRRLVDAG